MKTIFRAIVGSQSYGTATPTSDVDYKGIYIQPINDILGFKYKPQIEVGKDDTSYELKRYIELLGSANPTVLELLYSPEDCIVTKTTEFDQILEVRDKFLTKKCKNSFGGYAVQQIQKAKGLNKKMNYEQEKVTRKDVLDFCTFFDRSTGKTVPFKSWLKQEGYKQEFVGLAKIDKMKDCYDVYYDHLADIKDKEMEFRGTPHGFKGVIGPDSNEVRLSSIPKDHYCEGVLSWNKDGYTVHCKDYNSYQVWLTERNEQRFVDVKNHDQKIDGKNMLHCRRLLDTALEIAQEGTIKVRRPNADYLLQIRRGEVNLEKLIAEAEEDLLKLDEVYAKCSLPDDVDPEFLHNLLVGIRTVPDRIERRKADQAWEDFREGAFNAWKNKQNDKNL